MKDLYVVRAQKLIFLQSVDFSADFTWNLVDFRHEIQKISWNLVDFMKSGRFHMKFGRFHAWKPLHLITQGKNFTSQRGGGAMSFEICEISQISQNLGDFMKFSGFHMICNERLSHYTVMLPNNSSFILRNIDSTHSILSCKFIVVLLVVHSSRAGWVLSEDQLWSSLYTLTWIDSH